MEKSDARSVAWHALIAGYRMREPTKQGTLAPQGKRREQRVERMAQLVFFYHFCNTANERT